MTAKQSPLAKGYAEKEYSVTSLQLDQFVQKVNRRLDADRKAGRLKPFTGKLKPSGEQLCRIF